MVWKLRFIILFYSINATQAKLAAWKAAERKRQLIQQLER